MEIPNPITAEHIDNTFGIRNTVLRYLVAVQEHAAGRDSVSRGEHETILTYCRIHEDIGLANQVIMQTVSSGCWNVVKFSLCQMCQWWIRHETSATKLDEFLCAYRGWYGEVPSYFLRSLVGNDSLSLDFVLDWSSKEMRFVESKKCDVIGFEDWVGG